MKMFIALLSFFPLLLSFGQTRITVIDNSPATNFLFDQSNPESLISLLKNNPVGFKMMDYNTAEMLLEKGLLQSEITQNGPQSDIPFTTVEGYDSMVVINGYEQYVYPAPDKYYVDLEGVSRLLVVENNTEGSYRIEQLIFAKKYPGISKYVLTGSVYYADLTNNLLFYAEELNTAAMNRLVNDEDQLWKTWEKDCYKPEPTEWGDMIYAKPVAGLTWNSQFHPVHQFNFYKMLDPERIYSDNYWSREYTWPFTAEFVPNTMSYLKNYYGKEVKIEGREWSSYPLMNSYGEDSTITVDGETVYVMTEPDLDPYYIGITPAKTYLLYGINAIDQKKSLRRMVFTFNKNGQQAVLADYDCGPLEEQQNYTELIEQLGIPFETAAQTTWLTTLNTEKAKGRQISLNDKKAVKKLKKEYLELETLGIPAE